MTIETEAAELAATATLFSSAAAVLSRGMPVSDARATAFSRALQREAVPAQLATALLQRLAAGTGTDQVAPNRALSPGQSLLLVGALALFSLRTTSDSDPLLPVNQIAKKYGVTPTAVSELAVGLRTIADTERSEDLDESFRLLTDPPDALEAVVERLLRRASGARPRRTVATLSSARIQHAEDIDAAAALESLPGLSELAEVAMKYGYEQKTRVHNVAGRVRVGPKQFPGLHSLFRDCVLRAGIAPEPDLYLEMGNINAFTDCVSRPFVVLSSGAVSLLSHAELEFVLGHELGHIRFRHVRLLQMGRFLPKAAELLPGGSYLSMGLQLALLDSERKAELSADRLGLLVCQDRDAAMRLLVKLAGVPAALYSQINVDAFIAQYTDYEELGKDALGWLARLSQSATMTHPWTVVRAHELQKWIDQGSYDALLAGGLPEVQHVETGKLLEALVPSCCPVCRAEVPADRNRCQACGAPLTELNRMKTCQRCGTRARPNQRFCEGCGSSIGSPKERPS